MDINELKAQWLAEERYSFSGWDFSHLEGRCEEEALPWSYREWVDQYRKPSDRLLDMGTGGGEFLLSLQHAFANTSVTEAWEPNLQLCRKRLEPLGIRVAQVFDDNLLPFEDNSFDIVINRHESYDFSEVRRVLKPGGMFVTQQVGGRNNEALSKTLIPNFQPQFPNFTLDAEAEKCSAAGFFIIHRAESFPKLKFFDLGAAVYFAKIIPWEFPGFSVEKCFDALCGLQEELLAKGFVGSLEHRFLIVAQNRK